MQQIVYEGIQSAEQPQGNRVTEEKCGLNTNGF